MNKNSLILALSASLATSSALAGTIGVCSTQLDLDKCN
ncbi:Uncharacterised protein [Legionella cincinnatiensis]|uniref:Uncharacterized protein n=1 Tax=Legionella cincinnatiensis TaxID=28085 RepID=A0A378IGT2_9GAMM|nr:Uncharacterised protein [Legionella cincinnatiensis]